MEINAKSFVLSSRLKKRCWILLGVSLSALAISTYLALTHTSEFMSWEKPIFEAINGLPDSIRLSALIVTTALGSIWAFIGLSVVVTFLKAYRLAWWLSLSVFITYALVFIGKTVIDRARPEGLGGELILRATESSSGFPSGHTALATILSITLFFYLPKGWRWAIVLFWILSVAFTRMYLGVHSPLDIVGGGAIGAAVFAGLRLLPASVKALLRLSDKPTPSLRKP